MRGLPLVTWARPGPEPAAVSLAWTIHSVTAARAARVLCPRPGGNSCMSPRTWRMLSMNSGRPQASRAGPSSSASSAATSAATADLAPEPTSAVSVSLCDSLRISAQPLSIRSGPSARRAWDSGELMADDILQRNHNLSYKGPRYCLAVRPCPHKGRSTTTAASATAGMRPCWIRVATAAGCDW